MGIVMGEVSFDGRGPTAEQIAAKITELSTLSVKVEPPGPGDLDIHDQHAFLSFAAAPEEQLEVFSYRPGEAKKFYEDHFEGFEQLPIAKHALGLHEAVGTQVVYLRTYVGHEPTLMMATILALEALGGRPREPITEQDRREFGQPITEKELAARRKQVYGQFKKLAWIQLFLLPITIPLLILQLLFMIVLMPWRLWKAWRMMGDFEDQRKHKKLMSSLADRLEFVATSPDEFPEHDENALEDYTCDLEALGFVHALDYRVESDKKRGTGFARLFFHPTEHCLAEVNQVFSKKRGPRDMRCMIGSLLDDDWSLTTSDRQLNPISYAWRRPRSLWSYDTVKTPRQLFAEHLKRRQRMIECLHIGIQTNLNADAYFEYERKTHAARKAILASKTYAAIRAEMAAFEDTPMSEWLGDFSQFADASDKK